MPTATNVTTPIADNIVSQLHHIAKERRLAAVDMERRNPQLAQLYRAQAACYDDAAALIWAQTRIIPCGKEPDSVTLNPS
jgi:hypothetical protein